MTRVLFVLAAITCLSAAPPVRRLPHADNLTTHSNSFVVTPSDLSQHGTLFGGKTLAEMDRCAGITVRRFLYASPHAKDAVTVAVENVKFHKAGTQKDLVFVTGRVVDVGEKSVTVEVKVERELPDLTRELLADGRFVFVAYDMAAKKAVRHGIRKIQSGVGEWE